MNRFLAPLALAVLVFTGCPSEAEPTATPPATSEPTPETEAPAEPAAEQALPLVTYYAFDG